MAPVAAVSRAAPPLPAVDELERRLNERRVRDVFGDAELEGLPEPVCRYLWASIAPGTPLATGARLEMRGSIKVGPWVPFRAEEVLAPHEAFVWAARTGGIISGADAFVDGHGGMRWKLFGLVPVIRASGPDYAKSAAGRAGSEGMWLPTALLPRFGVRWAAPDASHVTASFGVGGVPVELRFTLDDEGRMRSLVFDRWKGADVSGPAGPYPFGGDVTDYRSFVGLTIPSEGRFGWFYGTDRWAEGEFFRYRITDLRPLGAV
jgi:hypothetical protein